MSKSVETEIENLNIYRQQMAQDIHDLKKDVKEIKDFLMGEEPKVVTKKEFESFKGTQNIQKIAIAVVTAVITSLITFEILRQIN